MCTPFLCFVSDKDQLDGKMKSSGAATPCSGTPQRWVGPENLFSDEGQTDGEIGTHCHSHNHSCERNETITEKKEV